MVAGICNDLRAHNIRANTVAPGAIANGLPEEGKEGEVDGAMVRTCTCCVPTLTHLLYRGVYGKCTSFYMGVLNL